MLQVQLEPGAWRFMEPAALVDGILQNQLQRTTPARDLARAVEGKLEELLGAEEFKALSMRLLAEVHAAFQGSLAALGFDVLAERLGDLRRWNLAPDLGRPLRLRIAWLDAWLLELLGREAKAIERYSQFLDRYAPTAPPPAQPPPAGAAALAMPVAADEEAELVLLAKNNRAVLAIRQGRLSYLDDLIEAALRDFLPGACLNLLNIVDMAWNRGRFGLVADRIADCLVRLDPERRRHWLPLAAAGPPSVPVAPAGQAAPQAAPQPAQPTASDFKTALNHPILRREFTLRLAALAANIATQETDELQLWSPDFYLLLEAPQGLPAKPQPADRHRRCAAAVALLYPRDIGDVLTRSAPHPTPMDSRIAKLIKQADRCLKRGAVAAAKRRLAQARVLLKQPAFRNRPDLAARIDALAARVRNYSRRQALRRFWRLARELEQRVAQLGALQEIVEIERRGAELEGPLQRLHALQEKLHLDDPEADLAAAFRQEIRQHLEKLRKAERAGVFQAHFAQLEELLPRDATEPIGSEAYRLLALCRAAAGKDERQSCRALEGALRRHDARHCLFKALQAVQETERPSEQAVMRWLNQAVAWDPSLAPHAAPLLGLLCLPPVDSAAETFADIRRQLIEHAKRIVAFTEPWLDESALAPSDVRAELLSEAIAGFQRVVAVLLASDHQPPVSGPDGSLPWKATRTLARVFRTALDWGAVEVVEALERAVEQWRDSCPTWYDYRHPYHALMRDLRVGKSLAEAQELLRRDRNPEGASAEKAAAKKAVAAALEAGVYRPKQLLRAVKLHAIARPLQGPLPQRARTLNRLLRFVKQNVLPRRENETPSQVRQRLATITPADIDAWIDQLQTNDPPQGGHSPSGPP